jgi:hypothetical protein
LQPSQAAGLFREKKPERDKSMSFLRAGDEKAGGWRGWALGKVAGKEDRGRCWWEGHQGWATLSVVFLSFSVCVSVFLNIPAFHALSYIYVCMCV